ncbi:MAG TPA: Smr/MutS family protein [Allosphingosinicella sp.]|nr:Smr/MutS family protein [Allosphingosinicella sp.]
MVRRLNADEAALWRKVVESVRPLAGAATPSAVKETEALPTAPRAAPRKAVAATTKAQPRPRGPGSTLDASWDRRLSRGLVQPDLSLDLHGHNLSTAYDLVDRKLEEAIGRGVRLLLLITGKPPSERAGKRGAIRAAVGDWLAVSRHSGEIAAVRNAHPRHGGSGALYIVLRRRRSVPRG